MRRLVDRRGDFSLGVVLVFLEFVRRDKNRRRVQAPKRRDHGPLVSCGRQRLCILFSRYPDASCVRAREGAAWRAAESARPTRSRQFDHLTGLEGISDAQLKEHLELYAGYVKQVNALNEELAEIRGEGKPSGKNPEFAEMTRRLGFEYNGMILHEYYFSNLKPRRPTRSRRRARRWRRR